MAIVLALPGRRMTDRAEAGPVRARARDERTAADDELLVERLAHGDRGAVDALYARYGRPLFGFVLDLVADPGLAEEVVQDTFVAAWRGAGSFERRSSVASWMFGIARRQARDRMRRRRPAAVETDALERLPDERRGPEAQALAAAARVEVAAALDRLPAHHREAIVLAFVHDLSGPEIAIVLGVPEGTVKSRLYAARRALRAALGDPEDRR